MTTTNKKNDGDDNTKDRAPENSKVDVGLSRRRAVVATVMLFGGLWIGFDLRVVDGCSPDNVVPVAVHILIALLSGQVGDGHLIIGVGVITEVVDIRDAQSNVQAIGDVACQVDLWNTGFRRSIEGKSIEPVGGDTSVTCLMDVATFMVLILGEDDACRCVVARL